MGAQRAHDPRGGGLTEVDCNERGRIHVRALHSRSRRKRRRAPFAGAAGLVSGGARVGRVLDEAALRETPDPRLEPLGPFVFDAHEARDPPASLGDAPLPPSLHLAQERGQTSLRYVDRVARHMVRLVMSGVRSRNACPALIADLRDDQLHRLAPVALAGLDRLHPDAEQAHLSGRQPVDVRVGLRRLLARARRAAPPFSSAGAVIGARVPPDSQKGPGISKRVTFGSMTSRPASPGREVSRISSRPASPGREVSRIFSRPASPGREVSVIVSRPASPGREVSRISSRPAFPGREVSLISSRPASPGWETGSPRGPEKRIRASPRTSTARAVRAGAGERGRRRPVEHQARPRGRPPARVACSVASPYSWTCPTERPRPRSPAPARTSNHVLETRRTDAQAPHSLGNRPPRQRLRPLNLEDSPSFPRASHRRRELVP